MPLLIYLRSREGKLHAYAGDPPDEAVDLVERRDRPGATGGPWRTGGVGSGDAARNAAWKVLGAECLVPMRGATDGELQGLAVLGPRLSEEPYSTRDKRLLASVASQAGIAMRSISLAEKMAERMEAERRAEQEMQIARQVQSRLLPQQAPVLKTLDIAGKCIQTRAVGGDYYDFLDFGAGKLGLVLADISGKGMSRRAADGEPAGQPCAASMPWRWRTCRGCCSSVNYSVLQEHRDEPLRDHVLRHLRRSAAARFVT